VLRPPEPRDAEDIFRGIANFNVVRMLDNPPWPYELAHAEAFIARANEARASGEELHLAVTIDDRAIGIVSIRQRNGAPHLGYWLAEPHWGRGYTTEAARALIRHFFAERDDDRLTSGALADNTASIKILTALGFEEVGRGTFFSNVRGEAIPHIDAALMRERFFELNP
jgi:RimJ/RimL family protein N-acetyltransferase